MSRKTRSSSIKGAGIGGLLLVLLVMVMAVFLPDMSPDTPEPPPGGQNIPQSPSNPLPGSGSNSGPVSDEPFPSWLTVYFTNPNPPDDINNGVDRYIVPIIDGAQSTIEIASFDLNLPSVLDALIRAKERGVNVRVIVDEVNGEVELDEAKSPTGKTIDSVRELERAKIKVVDGGRSNGLMHNKMLIVDSQILVMGSWNFSFNDTYRNNNNILVITAPTLIANYRAKFNEGFDAERFGAKSEFGAQVPVLNIDGVDVANYFSPRDEVMEKLVALVGTAQHSIHFYAFTYTHPDMSSAMIERFNAGVDVQGVIENRGASQGAMVPLYCNSVPVLVDGNKYTMHHKVIIIDDYIVITGSYNFTKSADDANDDNVLIIANSAVAQLYAQEYERIKAEAGPPNTENFTCP